TRQLSRYAEHQYGGDQGGLPTRDVQPYGFDRPVFPPTDHSGTGFDTPYALILAMVKLFDVVFGGTQRHFQIRVYLCDRGLYLCITDPDVLDRDAVQLLCQI